MISAKEEVLPQETRNKIDNWFAQTEADLVKQVALDRQTRAEVDAVREAHAYEPGQAGFTVTEKAAWARAGRYKIFLEVFEELKADRKLSTIQIHHHAS